MSSTSRLSSARNSLIPMRQPLAIVNVATAQTSAPITGVARSSHTAFPSTEKENAIPTNVAKKARLSLKPTVPIVQTQTQTQTFQHPPQPQPATVRVGPTSEANGIDMRPGYNAEMILGRDGMELSFEEVRAMHARYNVPSPAPPKKSVSSSASNVTRESTGNVILPSSFTPEAQRLDGSHRQPSPTICTRSAMNDIDAMFKDSPLTGQFSSRSLTTEIPSMMEGVCTDMNARGRPSPVAFTVYADEETRTLALSAAQAEREAASTSFSSKAYPPLTPILEMSHESDMSHASNTSIAAPTPAPVYQESTATQQPTTALPDNIVDPFDLAQREQWIQELSVLSTPGVTDLSDQNCTVDLDALANGSETSVELQDKLFNVTSVLSNVGSGGQRCLTLLAENLLEGGEVCLRFSPRQSVLEHTFSASCLARVLQSAGAEVEGQMKAFFYMTQESFVWKDLSCSISAVSTNGNLRQLLKVYEAQGKKMDERLVAYYCYELLKLIQLLHSHGYLHNTLTPDSIWLRYGDSPVSDAWSPAGENGWNGKGLALGEFNSGLDRSLFSGETLFRCEGLGNVALAANPLISFAQDQLGLTGWAEQLDLISLCAVTHAMIFGTCGDMDCVLDEAGSIQLQKALVSEFAQTTFAPVFETILNFRPSAPEKVQQESLDLVNLLMQHFEMALGLDGGKGQPHSSQLKKLLCEEQKMMLQKK